MGDAEKNSPMDGAYGGTYCAPMWAKFFAAALKDQPHPSFKTFPWTFSPWDGKMQAMSPSASASAVGQRSGNAEPRPDQDHHADAAADQDRRHAAADADQDQDAQADADADGHAQRAAQAGVVGRRYVAPPAGAASPRRVTTAGSGDSGLAGALAHWVAGLLGL